MSPSTAVPPPAARPEVPDTSRSWRLAPGVRLLWRGDGEFQLEHADGGVQVAGLDRELARSLARPAHQARSGGTHGLARPSPCPPSTADAAALARLTELGYLHATPGADVDRRHEHDTDAPDTGTDMGTDTDTDVGTDTDGPGSAERSARDTLRAALDERDRVATRREAWVDVVGTTGLAAYVGALLGAAGVGRIGFGGAGTVRRRHLLPGGLVAADEGRRFVAAAADAVARAAPRTAIVAPEGDGAGAADLTVVCLEAPVEPDLRDLLHHRRQAHLPVLVDAGRAEIGPFVVPGVSACLRCADLHRLDQDPAWTVLAVQLLSRADHEPPPDPRLVARTGALVADVVLRWLDDDATAGGTVGGSWELRSGGPGPWRHGGPRAHGAHGGPGVLGVRRRSRPPHPECSCRAAWTERAGVAGAPAGRQAE